MEHWRFNPETHTPGEGNVWDHARREYLSGVTATTICQRYGMSLRSFRLRARVERWRRIDRDDCDIPPEAGEYHPDDNVGFADLADQVFLNIRRAVGSGRASEASSWMRLYDKLADRARSDVMADLPDFPPPEPTPEPVHEPLLLTAIDEVETSSDSSPVPEGPDSACEALHLLHPVFSERTGAPEPADDLATPPEPGPETAPGLESSDTLEDIHRNALLLLRSRRLEHGIGVADIDRQLEGLGSTP